jgi:hypothetical protein
MEQFRARMTKSREDLQAMTTDRDAHKAQAEAAIALTAELEVVKAELESTKKALDEEKARKVEPTAPALANDSAELEARVVRA